VIENLIGDLCTGLCTIWENRWSFPEDDRNWFH